MYTGILRFIFKRDSPFPIGNNPLLSFALVSLYYQDGSWMKWRT